jgi:hypothetical protein
MSTTTNEAVATEVLAAEHARVAAIRDADWTRFADFLGEDLTYTHMNGTTDTKAENLALQQASPRTYKRTDLVVRVLGDDAAVMTGGIEVTVAPLPDGTPERVLSGTILQVWARREGRWQLVAAQATGVPR